MRRLAPRWDVLFVEGVPMRSVAVGDGGHELRRIVRKLRQGWSLRSPHPGLHVLRPMPVPPAGPIGRLAQVAALRRQVERALRHLRLDGPRLAWFSVPVAAPLLGRLGEEGSVLYYQDRYHEFSHVDSRILRAQLGVLARGCDATIATAQPLAADLSEMGAAPVVIRHGVEVGRFAEERPVPEELEPLERPLVGCVGLIDDHMDYDAVIAVAEGLDRGTVVLVGGANTSTERLRHRRIVLLGRRPYADIPSYVQAFDCCLVPFVTTPLTEAANPIKLREYLAAGRPVVSTPIQEVLPYADVVGLATGAEEWVGAVRAALRPEADTDAARRRRRGRVASETWDAVSAEVEAVLNGVMPAVESPG
jgi:glycosyltransferase involved in cell wall biosynthesis